MLWILLPISTSFELNCAVAASSLPSLSPLFRSAAQRFRGGIGKGDLVVNVEPDFLKPFVFYDEGKGFVEEWECEWESGKLEDGNRKVESSGEKGGVIFVETTYVVERSCPRFPSKALFSPRRRAADMYSGKMVTGSNGNTLKIGGSNVMKAHPSLPLMEARGPTMAGRRLSFLEVLRQGPSPA